MRKRWIGAAAILLLCLLTGCAGGQENAEADTDGAGAAVGYQEETIELPFEAAEESLIGMVKNTEGDVQIYTQEEATKSCIRYTLQADRSFQKEAFSGADEFLREATAPWTVSQGADGAVYFLYFDGEYVPHIIRTADGSTEELAAGEIEKQLGTGDYPAAVLGGEDGSFVVAYMGNQAQYFDAEGNLKTELQIGPGNVNIRTDTALNGSSLLASDMEEGKLTVYDLETGKETNQITLSSEKDFLLLRSGTEEDFYALDKQGLHHMTKDGKMVETCIDSADMLTLLEDTYPKAFEAGDDGDYYILYGKEGAYSLKYYSRKAQAEAVSQDSGKTLKIVGLHESNTMKRAISEFEKDYPDVRVEFQSYEEIRDRGTLSETIRIINADILSGENGADLIVLDGLPEDSYRDKGALVDLTAFTAELQGEDALLENLLPDSGEKVYSLPARFSVPILYGTEYAMQQLNSLETVLAFLENPGDTPLFGFTSYQLLAECLLALYYDEITEALPDAAAIQNYMDAVAGLGEYTNAMTEEVESYSEEAVEYLLHLGVPSCLGKDKAAISEIKKITDLSESVTFQKEYGQSIRLAGNMYIPYDSVGISAASQHVEEAQDFLRILLSYTIQSLDIGEGFPVNEKAFQELAPGNPVEESSGGWEEDGQEIHMTFTNPDEQDVERFKEMVREAEKPLRMDSNIRELLLDGVKRVYQGETDSESAAADVAQKLKLYLAEG